MQKVTRQELRQMLREETDTVNDAHVSDSELNRYINKAAAAYWDEVLSNGIGSQFVQRVSFDTISGQIDYSLATYGITDFYKIYQLYIVDPSGSLRSISRVNPTDLHSYTSPSGPFTVVVDYIPFMPWVAPDDVDTGEDILENVDVFNRWEEFIICYAAILIKGKKDDSSSEFTRRLNEEKARLKKMAMADLSEPMRVSRRSRTLIGTCLPDSVNTNTVWAIRGDTVQIYVHGVGGVSSGIVVTSPEEPGPSSSPTPPSVITYLTYEGTHDGNTEPTVDLFAADFPTYDGIYHAKVTCTAVGTTLGQIRGIALATTAAWMYESAGQTPSGDVFYLMKPSYDPYGGTNQAGNWLAAGEPELDANLAFRGPPAIFGPLTLRLTPTTQGAFKYKIDVELRRVLRT